MKFYLYSNNNLFDGYHIAVLYVYSIIFRALHARVCGVFDMIMTEDGKIIFVCKCVISSLSDGRLTN